ncbi:MAG TPA: acyltransferase [Myxococcales bacterium]|nr:acyltransferase [Myxococcales bacterium]
MSNSYKSSLARLFELDGPGGRIRSMEGLRGLAVALVFLVHYETLFGAWVPQGTGGEHVVRFLFIVGHCGVDLFFVLSGYLIYGAVLKSRTGYVPFMRRRVQRIYPTFFALFCTYVVLSIMLPSEAKWPPGQGARAIYLIENLLLMPGMFDIVPMMTVAWSLSYEVFYYALIPMLVGVLGMRAWRPRSRVLTFLALAAAFTVACFRGATHVQLILFVSGILVYEACQSPWFRRVLTGRAAQVAGFAALVAFLPVAYVFVTSAVPGLPTRTSYCYDLRAIWLFAALFVLVLVTFRAAGPLRALFSATPLRWLGNMSYSYYLMHGLTLKALALVVARLHPRLASTAIAHWAFLPVAFAVTLITSAVVFASIEKRFSLGVPRTATPAALPNAAPASAALASAA